MNIDQTIQGSIVNKPRIIMLDAMRGLALAGILLLHHIEHFDFFMKPIFRPEWLIPIDKWVWDNVFLFFSGKAFALFSLLFGFSYWIIYENSKKRGEEYLFRHFWRMALLFAFGCLHVVFFKGDILRMYAILGLPLIFTRYMSNKAIIATAAILLLNPVSLYAIGCFLFGPEIYDFRMTYPKINMKEILADGSFLELMQVNWLYGYQLSLTWSWNVGRILVIPGLFLLGVYFAKTKSFTERPLQFWYSVLVVSLISWLCLDLINQAAVMKVGDKQSRILLKSIVASYVNLSVMFSILSTFIIVWRHNNGDVFVSKFANFGRMGLTNYLLMSVIGALLYFGWGFSLYKYCGSTITLFIAILALMLQMKFSSYWLALYGQGPLENIWRKSTWIASNK